MHILHTDTLLVNSQMVHSASSTDFSAVVWPSYWLKIWVLINTLCCNFCTFQTPGTSLINSLNNHSSMRSLRSIFISVLFYKSPLWLILYSHIWNNDHMSAHMRVSDVCLLKCRQLCWPFSAYFKKTGTGSFTAWDEMIFSSSFVMRQREIFDLEWLDNHP